MVNVLEPTRQDIPPTPSEEKGKEQDLEFQVVNVREVKKREKEKGQPKRERGEFSGFGYWILFGTAAGVIFVLLALVNFRFIYLAPLGPISAVFAWFIKRLMQRFKLGDNLK